MTGNEGAGQEPVQDWLDRVFGQLQALTDEAVRVLADSEPPKDVAEAEKRARAVGVVARTAKAVAALKATGRKVSQDEEDDLADKGVVIDDAEEQRLRTELFARVDRLFEVAEQKGYGPKGDPFIVAGRTAPGDAGDARYPQGAGLQSA